ncbi:MAG: Hsp20/alpha crystallin family protein [Acidobacteriota bacterium]
MTSMIWNPMGHIRNDDVIRAWMGCEPAGEAACASWTPAVDIYEGDGALELKVELPEVDRKDMSITVENDTLTIQGERKFPAEPKREAYHRVERCYGTFARSFRLPKTVDQEKVKADYVNGVLKVVLPRKPELKPREVAVSVS